MLVGFYLESLIRSQTMRYFSKYHVFLLVTGVKLIFVTIKDVFCHEGSSFIKEKLHLFSAEQH